MIEAYDALVTGGGAPLSDHSAARHLARLSAVTRLYRARTLAEQEALHAQAAQLSIALGLPVPEMPAPILGTHQAALAALLSWVDALTAAGHRLNHARAKGVLAINLHEVQALGSAAHLVMPEKALQSALRACPRFVRANHTFNSPLAGKNVKCWVFRA